jgi:tRNA (guanine37-N1)-methyltransferase
MWVGVVSLFPAMFRILSAEGVVARAIGAGSLKLDLENPRDHAGDRHGTVDDRPYGGGPGMVMKVEPLRRAITTLSARAPGVVRRVYLSPDGERLTQAKIESLANEPALLFVAGRYEGIDERLLDECVDERVSIGDFVVTGGELPIMIVVDAIARHLPGTLGNADSALVESFRSGLLDCAHYTRPETIEGKAVPTTLLGGDHEAIRRHRLKDALVRTYARRPDLLAHRELSEEERRLLGEHLQSSRARVAGA